MLFSGNPLDTFSSAFTSQMLWYRLLPSPTNPTGVLLQVVFFAISLCAVILYGWWRNRTCYNALRLAGLAVSLGVFFLGGLVVSAKIGGGNNLHNLDAFFVLLWVIAGYVYFGRFQKDQGFPGPDRQVPAGWFALAAMIPILVVLPFKPLVFPTLRQDYGSALAAIQSLIDQAASRQNGEVLFISERQLLAFGQVRERQLVAEYDKFILMEMAMAGNAEFFAAFQRDLREHRFALIVSEPITTRIKGRTSKFGEENDVWVKWVSEPLLQEYVLVQPLNAFGVELFTPKLP